MSFIYLDHCASTPLAPAAKQAMIDFLQDDPYANAGAIDAAVRASLATGPRPG